MARKAIKTSRPRLLLNAEPFGFGPTAAIAAFFPHLRDHFEVIGYMGKKHTLDLQRSLSYDAIHDVTDTPKDERAETYAPILSQYDILLTAMDYKIAEAAQKAGLKVFYYDALAWYWPEIPDAVQKSDLYIAQDFFGVGERLKDVFARHADAHTVPAIAPKPAKAQTRDHVLINLGGLQNPFWPIDDVVDYARTVIHALRRAIPPYEKIVIAGSAAVAECLKNENVQTLPRADMERILAKTRMAFMTPGLGNIYDAAAFGIPTIWLPPANDSQGQQLDLLNEHDMCDDALAWSDIALDGHIDYKHDQPAVLSRIATLATRLSQDEGMQERLREQARRAYNIVNAEETCRAAKLIDHFGAGGEQEVARLVIEKAKAYGHG